jgi:hypothetical protein
VWTVRIADGICTVRDGFAERADVRYTAEARVWCAVALGIAEAKAIYREGLMTKDGGREAMDYYFHQIARSKDAPQRTQRSRGASKTRGSAGTAGPPVPSVVKKH